jgi:hypothetical protein
MLKFGSANNFSGNIGEQALKGINLQNNVLHVSMKAMLSNMLWQISSHIGVSTHSSETNNEMWESRGRYTIHFCKTNNRGVEIGEDKVF